MNRNRTPTPQTPRTIALLGFDGVAALDITAQECGFTEHEQLRRAFQRHRGITPQAYRQRFHTMKNQAQDG